MQFYYYLDREKELDWDEDLAGRLVRATPELLRKRFKCPECRGAKEVTVGRPGITKRWVTLVCPVGYLTLIPLGVRQMAGASGLWLQVQASLRSLPDHLRFCD